MRALDKQEYFFILSGEWESLSILFSLIILTKLIQKVAEGSRAERKIKAMGVLTNKIKREDLNLGIISTPIDSPIPTPTTVPFPFLPLFLSDYNHHFYLFLFFGVD